MNRSIRLVAIFAIILTIILLINLTIVQAFQEDKYANHPANQRGFYDSQTIARGQISAGGQVLAESLPNADETYSRNYPTNPQAFSNIVGYLSDQFGASQLEQSHNDILNGTDSSLLSTNWRDVITGKQPNGANLELTIDPNMQQFAYQQLAELGYQGATVAIQPSTGAVKAMASSPSFDQNTLLGDGAQDSWAELTSTDGNPLLNHATQETLPPGSIFKIITTAAGIEAGYGPESTLTGAPSITLPNTNTELTNYAGEACAGADAVSLLTAFQYSCNTAFVEMGIDIGDEAMRNTAQAFGIGENYDLGIPTSPGALGDLPDEAALGQSSIGQRDVTMSALQAAVMAATIANDGERMQPYVVDKITSSNLRDIKTTKPHSLNQAIPAETAATIEEMMRASEAHTVGASAGDIASKTGTAEHAEGSAPHTWYVAYLPDADLAVAVVVKNGGGQGVGATGGSVAAPLGRALLDFGRGQ